MNIKTYDELIKFHNEYSKYDKTGYNIDWKLVKRKYDGIIICPYLGYEIWNILNNSSNVTDFHLYTNSNKYIKDTMGENIMKYPKFYLEWYRHWETGTSVIWRKQCVKKINLITPFLISNAHFEIRCHIYLAPLNRYNIYLKIIHL